MANPTDLTFFTNEPGATLLDRFKMTLKDTRFFDVLVGYFRTGGFFPLAESFEKVEKIRILVGINVDATTHTLLEATKNSKAFDFESHKRTKENYSEGIIQELDHSPDIYDVRVWCKEIY